MVWKPNPLTQLAPVNVSPLIRAARWGALIVGIMYGRSRYNYLIKKEKPIQDEWDKLKAERKARLAKEWADYSDQQMQDLKRDSMRTD